LLDLLRKTVLRKVVLRKMVLEMFLAMGPTCHREEVHL
jgi:hypothetical protein